MSSWGSECHAENISSYLSADSDEREGNIIKTGHFNVHSIKESSYANLAQGCKSRSSEGKLDQPFCDAI